VTDLALVDRLARLYPAVVSDCLDRIGIRDHVLAPRIRPLTPESKVAGRARTVHCIRVEAGPEERDDW
jgi:regulator of RNase E activity RraA